MHVSTPHWHLYGQGRREEPEWVVLATVAVALLLGLALQHSVLGRLETATAGPVSLAYPATWNKSGERAALLSFADTAKGGLFAPTVAVRGVARADVLANEGNLADVAAAWSLARGQRLEAYRVLSIRPTTVNGREAMDVEYAYLSSGQLGSLGGGGGMPGLMHAVDTVVASGDKLYVLTFAAETSDYARLTTAQFPRFRSVRDDVLANWRLPPNP